MNFFLTLSYLFFIGSTFGWVLELLYRRFLSKANAERKWINPGFCIGPYVPLYGFGLCVLYLLSDVGLRLNVSEWWSKLLLILSMGICVTLIEYLAGIITLKINKVRLWDYRKEWANIQGIICPKFTLYWTLLSAVYYFFVNPYILNALNWLANNLAFSYVIGFFFGVFTVDACYSGRVLHIISKFAKEKDIIIKYEKLKSQIREAHIRRKEKINFLFPFKSKRSVAEDVLEVDGIKTHSEKNTQE